MKNKDLIALLSKEDGEVEAVFRTTNGNELQIGSVEWYPPGLTKGHVWEDDENPIVKIVERKYEE